MNNQATKKVLLLRVALQGKHRDPSFRALRRFREVSVAAINQHRARGQLVRVRTILKHMHSLVSDSKKLITLDEAANLLSVSRRTLEREIAAGRFPRPLKIGRATRVAVFVLEGYLSKLTGGSSPVVS